jgi:hypothetical protein
VSGNRQESATEMAATNQCDGCRLGLPVENGIHVVIGSGGYTDYYMGCTKDRYATPVADSPAVSGNGNVMTGAGKLARPEWKPTRGGDAYVTSTGEIIGEVTAAILAGGYYAEKRGKALGRFYDMASAKRAVESAP